MMADQIGDNEPPTLQEFWDRLDSADWYYEMSDDHSVWRRGNAAFAEILAIAGRTEEHRKLYDEFKDHKFSGEPLGTEQKPKPPRPES